MDIIQMAKELGVAIAASSQVAVFKEAEKAQNNDDEAQGLLGEYNLKRMQLMQRLDDGNATNEQREQIRDELMREYNKLLENSTIDAYVCAKQALEALIEQVNSTIAFYLSGEEKGCSHSGCGGCSGCH